MSNRIYLDYNATTPMSPEVLDFYKDQLSLYANASSLHEDGRRAKKEIEIARKNVADLVNVLPEEIVYITEATDGESQYVYRPEGLSGIVKDVIATPNGSYQLSYTSNLNTNFGKDYLPLEVEAYLLNRSGRDEIGYYAPLE